ncbi:MAG: hypothetical protein K2W95_15625 [Candidatus Obscuribacterales bacterium]|nr:hypothetical protein [Candidatus Obscuribacterales bacterium]
MGIDYIVERDRRQIGKPLSVIFRPTWLHDVLAFRGLRRSRRLFHTHERSTKGLTTVRTNNTDHHRIGHMIGSAQGKGFAFVQAAADKATLVDSFEVISDPLQVVHGSRIPFGLDG